MFRRSLRVLLVAALAAPTLVSGLAEADECTPPDDSAAPRLEDLGAADLAGITGHYALPVDAEPTKLVIFAHGYRNTADSWVCHLLEAAGRGNVAAATDYRGTGYAGGPTYGGAPASDNRGWFVREGAADSIAAAKHFLAAYPSITTVGLLGISMGGNSSGLAAATSVLRASGEPLFDYWVDVEGATNVSETYFEARGVANAGGTTGAYAGGAAEDIENELGASPSSDLATFATGLADLSVITHAPAIASNLKAAVVVHGLDDGLVPYDQGREMSTALRALGLPTDMFTVARRNDWQDPSSAGSEGGTVLSSNALGPLFGAAGQSYPAPFAGHGWEGSSTHLVIRTGFNALYALMDGEYISSNREYLVDSELGALRSP